MDSVLLSFLCTISISIICVFLIIVYKYINKYMENNFEKYWFNSFRVFQKDYYSRFEVQQLRKNIFGKKYWWTFMEPDLYGLNDGAPSKITFQTDTKAIQFLNSKQRGFLNRLKLKQQGISYSEQIKNEQITKEIKNG